MPVAWPAARLWACLGPIGSPVVGRRGWTRVAYIVRLLNDAHRDAVLERNASSVSPTGRRAGQCGRRPGTNVVRRRGCVGRLGVEPENRNEQRLATWMTSSARLLNCWILSTVVLNVRDAGERIADLTVVFGRRDGGVGRTGRDGGRRRTGGGRGVDVTLGGSVSVAVGTVVVVGSGAGGARVISETSPRRSRARHQPAMAPAPSHGAQAWRGPGGQFF